MGAEPRDRPNVHRDCVPGPGSRVSGPGPRDPCSRAESRGHQGAEQHTQAAPRAPQKCALSRRLKILLD